MAPTRIRLLGAPGSPYTRKMLALLRYRRIPSETLWGSHRDPPAGLPAPKVKLLPTFYFEREGGDVEAVVDSTPIIRRLESEHDGRSSLPDDAVLAFLNYLIEDYADEWLTKAMFHFRWTRKRDIENAGAMLIHWSDPTLGDEIVEDAAQAISQHQIKRLYVVGSNATTAETIENSYARFIAVLDRLIQERGYVLGARPSSADFALYGQLTQLGVVEPTSAEIMQGLSRRVRGWIDRVEDLSGLEPGPGDWLSRDEAGAVLRPLLMEIGRVYAPFLIANAAAVAGGRASFETEIDGRAWAQPTFPYQAKALAWIREAYADLDAGDRAAAMAMLAGTGCERLAVAK